MSRSLIKRNQLDSDVQDLIKETVQGLSPETIVYTTGNQIISGNKDFITTNRLTISGLTSPTPFVVFGHGMFNINAGPGYNTNAVFEAYKSGDLLTDIKINNPSNEINSKAGLFLASPGNNVILYTTANNNGYRCIFSGSQFTNYAFESNNTRRLLISGNKVIVGNATINENGANLQIPNGITFPFIKSPSTDLNTLDDYEEGTWIPNIKGDPTVGSATYSARNGYYIKIGKQVFIHGRINISNIGGAVGNLYLDPLPFNTATNANSQSIIYINFFSNLATNVVNLYGIASVNSNRINLFKLAGASTTSNVRLLNTDITNTTDLIFAGNYRAAN